MGPPAGDTSPSTTGATGSSSWKWGICVLLLLATTLNYMDRQALSQTAKQIRSAFSLDAQQYSYLGGVFNIGFGIGALTFGYLVDKGNLRWIYAGLVLAWSAVGFATGYVSFFWQLLICRLLLGIFEAGNWPCGIMTVKRVLKPEERSLGNGMFQSGTALGAILIPLVVVACYNFAGADNPLWWQIPFRVIGVIGLVWVAAWLWLVKPERIAPAPLPVQTAENRDSYWDLWRDRRFYVMIVVIIGVNAPWRTCGEWLPQFLDREKGYDVSSVQYISSAFYLAADAGAIGSGLITLWLVRRGRSLYSGRMVSLVICVALTLLLLLAIVLPKGPLLIVVLLLIAFGTLGSFSTYFAFSQEISARHQGKVTGTLGLINSIAMGTLVVAQGNMIKTSGESYALALGLTAVAPVFAVVAIALFWNPRKPKVEGVAAGV